MALYHNTNIGIYSGVSKQAIDLRLANHCEEMINCYPTVENGTRRRNPTSKLSSDILVSDNQFTYAYDRGLSGETSEQYVITIDEVNKLRVFDIYSGKYSTVNYEGNSLSYLNTSNAEIGFSAMTIKDSTFIVNRDTVPRREGDITSADGSDTTFHKAIISLSMSGYTLTAYDRNSPAGYSSLAPARVHAHLYFGYAQYFSSLGATTIITVDGTAISYITKTKQAERGIVPETLSEYRSNLVNAISSALPDDYVVSINSTGGIEIVKTTGSSISVSSSMSFPSTSDFPVPSNSSSYPVNSTTIENKGVLPLGTAVYTTSTETTQKYSDYDKQAFIWIKQVSIDPAFPYTFTLTIKNLDGTTVGTTTSASTTTNGVATALSFWANGLTGFASVSDGSVIKITRDDGTGFDVVVSDTFGSQASSAFKGIVEQMSDVPKSFPFKDTILKVDGIDRNDGTAYWVKYDGNKWIEHRDPTMLHKIRASTMPHQLVRNADLTFTFKALEWNDILVGDEDSQSIPEFIGNPIKDMFFVNGRFGILTENGISLSEQGNITNFFRTTVLSLLDDSAITTYIDSFKSVGLQYAVELQSSIILFGDKIQFALDASKGLTPATLSVQPISGFEINKNVKPLSTGDSVFFLVSKNNYSSLMEMNKTTISMNIRANDVSAHIPDYISNDIMQIVASDRDNAIFLRSRSQRDTVYLYKHYGTETEKIQMSWSKWIFSMDINSIFAFDKNLYLFGQRHSTIVPTVEFTFYVSVDDTKLINDETFIVDDKIPSSPSFEILNIDSYSVGSNFKDVGNVRYNSEIHLSEFIPNVNSGKYIVGTTLLKTMEISSEDGSNFYLSVKDVERGTVRNIPSLYTIDRKPYISGNSKNMRVKIVSTNGDGFQINSISNEIQYNSRSKKI
jgi:hypothetical protein